MTVNFVLIFLYITMQEVMKCNSEAQWLPFSSSNYYSNVRMITEEEGVFQVEYLSKEIGQKWAMLDCARLCFRKETCEAFNLYENGSVYVCEMIPDNLCLKKLNKAFIGWPGCSLWEKRPSGTTASCIDIILSSSAITPCEVLRPGCLGTWPNCSNCVKHCRDCKLRWSYTGFKNCTFWLNGDIPFAEPIFGQCYNDVTYFMKRQVNVGARQIAYDYRMSFANVNRMCKLKAYSKIVFYFSNSFIHHEFIYDNFFIESNGTITMLRFVSGQNGIDIFNPSGQGFKSTPFVYVTDDLYNCGSFWLLAPNNGTYCPGGNVGMFGALKTVGTQLVNTGIKSPLSSLPTFMDFAAVELRW